MVRPRPPRKRGGRYTAVPVPLMKVVRTGSLAPPVPHRCRSGGRRSVPVPVPHFKSPYRTLCTVPGVEAKVQYTEVHTEWDRSTYRTPIYLCTCGQFTYLYTLRG